MSIRFRVEIRLDIPPKRKLSRAWESMQLWLELKSRMQRGEDESSAVAAVAARTGATEKRVREGAAEFEACAKKAKR